MSTAQKNAHSEAFTRWHWRFTAQFNHEVGPPARSSPGTSETWPLLRSLHRWWFDGGGQLEGQEPRKTHIEDEDPLHVAATDFVREATRRGFQEQLYWVAEAEQSERVCYFRLLKPIIGDVYAHVEVTLAKQVNVTYVEMTLSSVEWWRWSEVWRRFWQRAIGLLVWLVFSALSYLILQDGTGAIAVVMALSGVLVLAGLSHWDFYIDYGRIDWKCIYPFQLWRSRFEVPVMIQITGFCIWRFWNEFSGQIAGPGVVCLPVLYWLPCYWIWKTTQLVKNPQFKQIESKDLDGYLDAVSTILLGPPPHEEKTSGNHS